MCNSHQQHETNPSDEKSESLFESDKESVPDDINLGHPAKRNM